MDPISNALATLLNAVQAVDRPALSTAAPLPALMALLGQDVSLQFLGLTEGGALLLQLPSGQTVTAQGQLPYPDGTQLLVRILAGSGADAPLRLQTLQATPPAAPAILAPLLQGEAAPLLASLGQPDPPAGLAQLVELFQYLGGGSGQGLPDAARIQTALDSLPAPVQASLRAVLDLSPGGQPGSASGQAAPASGQAPSQAAALAAALEVWLAAAPGAATASSPAGHAPDLQGVIQDLLQRFQSALDRHPEVPPAQADTLNQWLKNLVSGAESGPAKAPLQADRSGSPASPAQALQAALGGRSGAPPAAPETWETWIRTSVKVLSDPATSPQGAAFHAAQAKEGTAFYEIPLPWAPQHPLQMWVEDRDPRDRGQGQAEDDTRRVLLGLSFSNLGETRLGIAKSGGNLQVRVWAEHPDRLEETRAAVQGELEELGSSVDLKIMALNPGPGGTIPSLRSQVTGATLQALG